MDRTSRLRLTGIALMFVVATATVACSTGSAPGWTFAPAPSAAAAAPSAAAPSAAAPSTASSEAPGAVPVSSTAPAAAAGEFAVEAFDLGFKPSTVTVRRRGGVQGHVQEHRRDPPRPDLRRRDEDRRRTPARPATGTVTVPAAGITFICSIPGHADAGMKGSVSRQRPDAPAARDSHGGPAPDDERRGRPERPQVHPLRRHRAEGPRRDDPRHRPRRPGEAHDRSPTASSRRSGRSTGPSRARSSGSTSATRSGSTSRTRPRTSSPTASTSTPARSPGTTR